MADRQLHARIAGLLYLIVVVSGIFSLAYVPGQLIVDGDIGATIANIATRAPLYRLGIMAGMICYTAFLLLPLAMYRLFAPWSAALAAAMVALATVSVPIAFGSLQSQMDVLALVEGPAGAAGNGQHEALTALALQSSNDALRLVKVFWGLWLLPLGLLVLRSRALPVLLGVLLIAGCRGLSDRCRRAAAGARCAGGGRALCATAGNLRRDWHVLVAAHFRCPRVGARSADQRRRSHDDAVAAPR